MLISFSLKMRKVRLGEVTSKVMLLAVVGHYLNSGLTSEPHPAYTAQLSGAWRNFSLGGKTYLVLSTRRCYEAII